MTSGQEWSVVTSYIKHRTKTSGAFWDILRGLVNEMTSGQEWSVATSYIKHKSRVTSWDVLHGTVNEMTSGQEWSVVTSGQEQSVVTSYIKHKPRETSWDVLHGTVNEMTSGQFEWPTVNGGPVQSYFITHSYQLQIQLGIFRHYKFWLVWR